tara:strand:- start:3220 stop:3723 length:504 start_codon:yes stop_codon:yes gene_type:complete
MYKAKVAEQTFEFEFSDEKALEGTLNGEAFKMDTAQQDDVHHVLYKHGSYKVKMVHFDKENKTCVIQVNSNEYVVTLEDRFDALLHQLGMDNINNQKVNELKAPMPGLVLSIMVQPGDSIVKGDGLMVLEAMKMENIIRTPADGIVKSLEVEKSDAVEKNQVLIKFE